MFERRTLLALVIVGIVLLLLPQYYKLISPERPQPAPADTTAKVVTKADTAAPAPKEVPPVAQAAQADTTRLAALVLATGPDTAALVTDSLGLSGLF